MKASLILILIALFSINLSANPKYDKWQDASYFRGYNVLYESPKTLQDFIDFKNYGGNLFHIQPDGFLGTDAPYDLVQANIDGCDMLVNFCRQAGIHYVIGMRSGPGAYDTYDESIGTTGESRVWNTGNTTEQNKYSEMLGMVVNRYAGDTLFVGLNLVIEPRPKVNSIPANNSAAYKLILENVHNIHMDQVYNSWVSAIRTSGSDVPIIIENFAYSTPELFPAYVINDPFIIYSAHNYQPTGYTKEAVPFNMSYPGVYWNISTLSQVLYNAQFMRETVFGRLREFQQATTAPVFIGEMGMFKPQTGGEEFLADQFNIFKDYGWHYALWDWRRSSTADWNIEKFGDPDDNSHWRGVLSEFHAPPVPSMISPAEGDVTSQSPTFTWDSLTAYTSYDLEISKFNGRQDVFIVSDIGNSVYALGDRLLKEGETYSCRIRSKNPGGNPESISGWSNPRLFTVDSLVSHDKNTAAEINEYSLKQNYPNPFNPVTSIYYSLKTSSNVKLSVYDMLGREVYSLVNSAQFAGEHSAQFNANGFASGIYIYRLEALPVDGSKGFIDIKKMILVK